MTSSQQAETQALARSWMQHDATHLRDYLVQGVEDPRINFQSILTRHFLLSTLFPGRFALLMEQELRFSAVMNWLLRQARDLATPELRRDLVHALRNRASNADGIVIPAFVFQVSARLPIQLDGACVPNYIEEYLDRDGASVALDTFQELWKAALRTEPPTRTRVLEPACGSANDYRYLARYGIARLLDYSGFDLCEKNVTNARTLFPDAKFDCANVFAIPAADGAFELSFVHDLFEHLSLEALPVAVSELCRVTRKALCIGFFQMEERVEHFLRPVEEYHWNILSAPRMGALLEKHGFRVQCLHMATYQRARTGCAEMYNPNAYSFVAIRR